MKRSTINLAYREARASFARHRWTLPPNAKWDITDFNLGEFDRCGLTLVNLALEPEYSEKLMFAWKNQVTPCHAHQKKKEDVICRAGELVVQVWPAKPKPSDVSASEEMFVVRIDGEAHKVRAGAEVVLRAGSRVTLTPGLWHAFWPASETCILGEVSTANDDVGDNYFLDPRIDRFAAIEEDEPAVVRLVRE